MLTIPFSYDQISGTLINYYMHCQRQAWLFNSGLHVEDESDAVNMGKIIDKNTFKRTREVEIMGERIKVDFINENKTPVEIHEVKASKIPRNDHKMQLAFYLKKFKERGVSSIGIIHYPQINTVITVTLDDTIEDLNRITSGIITSMNGECPPKIEIKSCRKCAYFEFCYSNGDDQLG